MSPNISDKAHYHGILTSFIMIDSNILITRRGTVNKLDGTLATLILIGTILLSACGGASPTPDEAAIAAAVVAVQ